MKHEFAQMIKESVHDLFIAFMPVTVTPGPMISKKEDDLYHPPNTEVTAIINFSGGIQGGVHLACPTHTAVELAASFADESFKTMDGEAGDSFGEINNIIAGGLQTRLSDRYGNISLTPPTLITGTDYSMQYKTNFNSVKQYFKCDSGPFFVEFYFYIEGYTP